LDPDIDTINIIKPKYQTITRSATDFTVGGFYSVEEELWLKIVSHSYWS
jgi:hypothetical protein